MGMRARLSGGLAIGMTLAVLGSPVAQADDDSFVRTAKGLGFVQTPPNLLLTAKSACYMLSYNNRIPSEIEARIQRYTMVSPEQAHQFFDAAIHEYCPQYSWVTEP